MSRSSTAAETEPTPTPTPVSGERVGSETASSARVHDASDQIDRFADCRSMDELPVDLRDNPFIAYVVGMTPEEEARELAAVQAHREAEALYADEPERILAAIEAGTHPLQRSSRSGG